MKTSIVRVRISFALGFGRSAFLPVLVVLLFTPFHTHAQVSEIDSLKRLIKDRPADTVHVQLLWTLADKYTNLDLDTASALALEGLDLSRKMGYRYGEMRCLNAYGNVIKYLGDYKGALAYYDSTLVIAMELGDSSRIASTYNNMGNVYQNQGKFKKAIELMLQCIRIREAMRDTVYIGSNYSNLGAIYNDMYDSKSALLYLHKGLDANRRAKNKSYELNSLINLGYAYMTDNQWDKALEYTIMGRDLAMELGNPYSLSKTYANLSVCYQTVRKYDLALENMLKGLELVREFGDDQFTARMLLGTAVVNRFLKRYPLSIAYLDTALFYAERIQSTENLYEIYGEYYNVYGLMGNTDSAMAYVGKFIQLKDTLYSMENRRLVAEMQEAYEMEKKDREIVILNQEKELKQKELNRQKILRNGLTGGLAVVFLFAGVFLFQRNRIAREKKYSDNLLLNILPAETAQELKTKGYADAKSYDEVTDVH